MEKSLKRFTDAEDQLLLENWWDPRRRPDIIQQTQRSGTSLNLRYYRLLKEKAIDPALHRSEMRLNRNESPQMRREQTVTQQRQPKAPKSHATKPGPALAEVIPDDAISGRLETLETKLTQIDHSLQNQQDKFVTWLENILYMYKTENNALSMSLLMKENAALQEELQACQRKVVLLEKQLIEERESHEKVFKELDFWLGQFLKLSSIEKVATLGDFVPRLKTIVDKYGTVLTYQPDQE